MANAKINPITEFDPTDMGQVKAVRNLVFRKDGLVSLARVATMRKLGNPVTIRNGEFFVKVKHAILPF